MGLDSSSPPSGSASEGMELLNLYIDADLLISVTSSKENA
jgi:hypothetical protein